MLEIITTDPNSSLKEKYEDTKEIIGSRKSNKDRPGT
jgi:hypothetical protein